MIMNSLLERTLTTLLDFAMGGISVVDFEAFEI